MKQIRAHEPFYAARGEMTARDAETIERALRILKDHGVNVRMTNAPGNQRVAPPYETGGTIERVHVSRMFDVCVNVTVKLESGGWGTICITPPEGNDISLGSVDGCAGMSCKVRVIPVPRRGGVSCTPVYEMISVGNK